MYLVMGRMGANGHSVYAAQMTVDLNTKNQSERARLAAKDEQFALVGDRVLGQIGVTRCKVVLTLPYFMLV